MGALEERLKLNRSTAMDFNKVLTKRKTLIAISAFVMRALNIPYAYSKYASDGQRLRNYAEMLGAAGRGAEAVTVQQKAVRLVAGR